MHTAICTFDNPALAERAVDRLVEAGFDRRDIHMERRHADGTPVRRENDAWDGMEREIAMDRGTLRNLGNFFASLFGQDDAQGHAGAYSRAVERGHCVVVVEANSDAEGDRAQAILHGLEAGDLHRFHRPAQRPLRDIVGERQARGMEQGFGTARAEMGDSHNRDVRREGEFPRERERAMADPGSMSTSTGWGEQRTLELRDQPEPDDASHAPGLRYADMKDKPR